MGQLQPSFSLEPLQTASSRTVRVSTTPTPGAVAQTGWPSAAAVAQTGWPSAQIPAGTTMTMTQLKRTFYKCDKTSVASISLRSHREGVGQQYDPGCATAPQEARGAYLSAQFWRAAPGQHATAAQVAQAPGNAAAGVAGKSGATQLGHLSDCMLQVNRKSNFTLRRVSEGVGFMKASGSQGTPTSTSQAASSCARHRTRRHRTSHL